MPSASVSVIIPTHNRSKSLQCAIASVLGQTLQDLEVIVVDDASSDDTAAAVAKLDDGRIIYVRHEQNKGVAAARNTGLLRSCGQYIAFLDDDDEWLPGKLQLQFSCLERSPLTVGAVYTSTLVIDSRTGNVMSRLPALLRGRVYEEMFVRGFIAPTSALFFRRQCFDAVGFFDPALRYGEDHDMWLRIAKEFEFECIDEPLVRYTSPGEHKASLSMDYESVLNGKETYLRRYASLFRQHPAMHALYHVNLGVLYGYSGNLGKSRKAFCAAIRINPRESRAYFNLSLTLLGAKTFRWLKKAKEQWRA